jgi:hypothetical protein
MDVLAEAGLAYDDELGGALESLRALCPPTAPEPTGALAELLEQGAAGNAVPAVPTRASRRAAEVALDRLGLPGALEPREAAVVRFAPRKRHRGAIISAAVVAGVGLGASGVAALGGVDYSAEPPQALGPSVAAPLADGPEAISSAVTSPDVASQEVVTAPPQAAPKTPAVNPVEEARASGPRHRATPPEGGRGRHVARVEAADELVVTEASFVKTAASDDAVDDQVVHHAAPARSASLARRAQAGASAHAAIHAQTAAVVQAAIAVTAARSAKHLAR